MKLKLIFCLLIISGLFACSSKPENLRQCGTVSGYLAPDITKNLYPVVVTHLDGKPVSSKPNYWLAPGQYEFTVAELINNPKLKVMLSARKTKTLTINVVSDEQYHLAAKFNTDRQYTGNNRGYWEPIVWKIDPLKCELPASPDE